MDSRVQFGVQHLLRPDAIPSLSTVRSQRREDRTIHTFSSSRESRFIACRVFTFAVPHRHPGLRVGRIPRTSGQDTRCMGNRCVGSFASFARFPRSLQPGSCCRIHALLAAGGTGSTTKRHRFQLPASAGSHVGPAVPVAIPVLAAVQGYINHPKRSPP